MFRNQARGTENKGKKEFVNVLCRRIPLLFRSVLTIDVLGSITFRLPQAIYGKCPNPESRREVHERSENTNRVSEQVCSLILTLGPMDSNVARRGSRTLFHVMGGRMDRKRADDGFPAFLVPWFHGFVVPWAGHCISRRARK